MGIAKTGQTLICASCLHPFYVPACRLRRQAAKFPKYCSVKCRTVGLTKQAKHGHNRRGQRSATYKAWLAMKNRTTNRNDSHWKYYGARGISICTQWVNSFEQFLADMGECPDGLTLERIDNNGNYKPSNCRWATQKEQTRNQRRSRMLTFQSRTQCLGAWAEELGRGESMIRRRLNTGWPIEWALFAPLGSRLAHLKAQI